MTKGTRGAKALKAENDMTKLKVEIESKAREPISEEVLGKAADRIAEHLTAAGVVVAALNIPLAEAASGYCKRHVDMRFSVRQAAVLDRITRGLKGQPFELDPETGAIDPNGRLVDVPSRAIAWILNQIDAQLIATEGMELPPETSDVPEGGAE